jgi:SARP family transcriptional regulator, regulator of embCAB operon
LRYELLGPLRVVDAGAVSFVGPRKVEVLLALLLARADQVVSTDQLINEIWGDRPPRRANATIHVYVSQLRKFLSGAGCTFDPIVTRPPGYMLRTGSDSLDVHDFQRLVNQGRSAARTRQHEEAVTHFEAALALWRGPVLGDLRDGPAVNAFATWVEEVRLECLELLVEASLELGRHREIVGRLYTLTTEHPLREAFCRQLMLALYRSERQADALSVYQKVRQKLHGELGLEPCRALREVHHAILVADPQLDCQAA